MASARIARFATEAAPPQFVTVMRQRASKMLDTIHEEDQREIGSDSFSSAGPKSASFNPSPLQPCSSSSTNMPPKYIFKALQGRISIFGEIKN